MDQDGTDKEKRGITIFSKQAELTWRDTDLTLLDTPGHVDFSAEMERVLQVLDYAVLLISGSDGVQGHTQTLWNLLQQYEIPTFFFVNKMDQLKNSIAGQYISLADIPTEGIKMANAILATGPIIFLYPFVQKYFISGITVGAVKG
jgi:small GTP-binding protein